MRSDSFAYAAHPVRRPTLIVTCADIYRPNSAHQQFAKHSRLHRGHIFVIDPLRGGTAFATKRLRARCVSIIGPSCVRSAEKNKGKNITPSRAVKVKGGRSDVFFNGPCRPTNPDKKGEKKDAFCANRVPRPQ